MQIGPACTICAACFTVCPNHAIRRVLDQIWIDALSCTECAGYAPEPECRATCPEGAIDYDVNDNTH